MKKYTIEDLIIEEPVEERHEEKKRPRGKVVLVIGVAVLLIAGAVLSKRTTERHDEINTSDMIEEESGLTDALVTPEVNREAEKIRLAKGDDEGEKLLDQIVPLRGDKEENEKNLSITENEKELVEPSAVATKASTDTVGEVSAAREEKPEVSDTENRDKSIEESGEAKLPVATTKHAEVIPHEEKSSMDGAETESVKAAEPPSPEEGTANLTSEEKKENSSEESRMEAASSVAGSTVEKEEKISDILLKMEKEKQESNSSVIVKSEPKSPEKSAHIVIKSSEKPPVQSKTDTTKRKPVQRDLSVKKKSRKSSDNSPADRTSVYFVQTGVFNRMPDKKYLESIRKAGLKYRVIKSGKIRRVRVGPYATEERAIKAQARIKKTIGTEGLIVKSLGAETKTESVSPRKSGSRVSGEKHAAVQSSPEEKHSRTEKEKAAVSETHVRQKSRKRKSLFSPATLFAPGATYYVQTARFNGNPPKSFLKRVRKAHLRYYVTKNRRGPKSVLIGPYGSYGRAKSAVGKIARSLGVKGTVVKAKRR